MIHFDIPWSLMTFQQRNGRIDRYGQERTPVISYLLTGSSSDSIRGDQRILEILIEKDQQVHRNIGDPSEFTGKYDSDEEEIITAKAMETGQSVEEFEKALQAEDDPWAELFANAAVELDDDEPAENLFSFYEDDYAFYREVVEHVKAAHAEPRLQIQAEYDPENRTIVLTKPQGFIHRESFLPREVIPADNRYVFTTDRQRVTEEIAACRKEESAWPRAHLLWDQHPLAVWLRENVLAGFGRHEAPVLITPELDEGEAVYIASGIIPNEEGQTVLQRWMGVHYADYANGTLAGMLDLEQISFSWDQIS